MAPQINKAQPKYLARQTKHQVLLKYDEIEPVKTQAGQIWKIIVENIRFILRQGIYTLIEQVLKLTQAATIMISVST